MTLLGPSTSGTSTVLAGGVALYATNEFLTISLLPSAVADIGGQPALRVGDHPLPGRIGGGGDHRQRAAAPGRPPRGHTCSVWPSSAPAAWSARWHRPWRFCWPAGRCRARPVVCWPAWAMRSSTPRCRASLWTRASALVSAMWGVGTLMGPAAGGLFAQFGLWRWAFGVLAFLTVAMAVLVPLACRRDVDVMSAPCASNIPVWSLLLLGTAACRSASRNPAGRPRDRRAARARRGPGDRVLARRPSAAGGGVAAQRVWPGPVEVDLLTLGLLMAAADGRHVCAAVRAAAGAPGAGRGRISGGSAGHRLDAQPRSPARRSTADAVIRRVVIAPLVMAVGLALAAFTQARRRAGRASSPLWALALADHRSRHRGGLAPSVRLGDGMRRRSGRGWRRGRRDQHRRS